MKKRAIVILFSSGLSPRHHLMLRTLRSMGLHVTVVAWDRTGGQALTNSYPDAVDEWLWIRLPAPTWSLRLLFKVPVYYKRLRDQLASAKADLYVATHIALLPVLAFRSGKKIYDAAEMFAADLALYFGSLAFFFQSFIYFCEGMLVRKFDGVLTVDSRSGWLEQKYRRWHNNVQVIWNVPAKNDDPSAEEIAAVSSRYSDRRIVAYVGGLMKEKGLRVALNAAAIVQESYPQVLFLFIGSMKDDETFVRTLIKDKTLDDCVEFTGAMSYREMLSYLKNAEVGLALHQKSRNYRLVSAGNGRKFFSYMQAGVPIVGPNFFDIAAVVRDENVGVLTDTTDEKKTAEAICDLLGRADRCELAQKARNLFIDKYNWEKESDKFVGFISRIFDV